MEKTDNRSVSVRQIDRVLDILTQIESHLRPKVAAVKPSAVDKENRRIAYGEFVRLTPEEHTKLTVKLGTTQLQCYINRLNNAIGSKGYKYKSHYHTILAWVDRDNVVPQAAVEPDQRRML